jgi:hypothetical protein
MNEPLTNRQMKSRVRNAGILLAIWFAVMMHPVNGQQIFQKEYVMGNVIKLTERPGTGYYMLTIGGGDPNLSHVNYNGNMVWSKRITGCPSMLFNDFIMTNDYSVVMVGSAMCQANNKDIIVIKLDSTGNIMWDKRISGLDYDEYSSSIIEYDNGFLITGKTNTAPWTTLTPGKGFLARLNSQGDILWFRGFGNNGYNALTGMLQLPGKSLLITGTTSEFSGNAKDLMLMKTDSNGVVLWSKVYPFSFKEAGLEVLLDYDGNYIMSGQLESTGLFRFFAKTDTSGNLIWAKVFDHNTQSGGTRLRRSHDGGYIFCLSVGCQVVKTDSAFNVVWTSGYNPGFTFKDFFDVIPSPDNGYIAGGRVNNNGNALLIKLDSLMDGGCNKVIQNINITTISMSEFIIILNDSLYSPVTLSGLTVTTFPVQTNVFCQTATGLDNIEHEGGLPPTVYPNPFESVFVISNLPVGKPVKISVRDTVGRMVQEKTLLSQADGILNMSGSDFPAGWYHLRLALADGKFFNLKLLKQ